MTSIDEITDDDVAAPSAATEAFAGVEVNLISPTLGTDEVFEILNTTFPIDEDDVYENAVLGTQEGDVCTGQECLLDFRAGFTMRDANDKVYINVMSRQLQDEALAFAQGAFFVTIVVVQWADLLICKTRILSIRQQGLKNKVMNFGLMFETILAAYLCYIEVLNIGLGTRNLRLTHWFPGMPFSMLIFLYDETRKFLIRSTSSSTIDPETGRIVRHAGWLERNTYY